ncbi:hypothetical protein GCM10011317_50310 [Niveispirillum cyanobacteriorum]|nr:hypothetical protein GCM10011317_50310 [Niveispirillum cyanobacteriorum]
MVRLAEIDLQVQARALGTAQGLDIGQRLRPIDLGFTGAEHVQVRPVQNKDRRLLGQLGPSLVMFAESRAVIAWLAASAMEIDIT